MRDQNVDRLLEAARVVRENAHAPFSKFRVGAALETEDGRIITGCNVENATNGLTLCAERVAVFKAISEGYRRFVRVGHDAAVHHHLVTVLIAVRQVQDVARRALEPAHGGTVAVARQNAEARGAVPVEHQLALAARQQLVVEVERQVVQDGVSAGDAEVVGPARAGQARGQKTSW